MIHLTAIIASGAKIGANVEIGPHSIIGGAVSIGDDSIIGANVVIEGEVIVGRETRIAHGTVIGGEPQDLSFSPTIRSRVKIGAKNVIREHCTIHRGTAEGSDTKIGDENFLMAGAHVGYDAAESLGLPRTSNGIVVVPANSVIPPVYELRAAVP